MDYSSFINTIKDKKVTFCGIARSNLPVIEMLTKEGIRITARDKKNYEQLGESGNKLKELGIELISGDDYLKNIDEDILFRAPGVPFLSPELTEARRNGVTVTSEMEVFFDLCPCRIFAVTGSDGKTTTTTIISEFLKAQGYKVHLGGNIGKPLLPELNLISKEDVAVIELSSFQLISMRKSPDVAVVTNLAPNHLDVHKDMEEYVQAKKNILLHQNAFSRAVLNADNSITDSLSSDVRGNLMKFSRRNKQDSGAYALDGKIYVNGEYLMDAADIYIPGLHNLENYLAAICAVWGYVSKENIKKIAATFTGVEHRMELVRELNGVKYYNDSIATSPSRAMMGTLSVYNRKIIMIAGGADKNVPFDTVGNEICKKVKLLILIEPLKQEPGRKPCASMKLKAAVTGAPEYSDSNPEIIVVHTMEDAVLTAKERAKSGDIVSLCPVCTAFDMYANFEVRGKYYKETVNRLL